jgi:tRNA(fMet)-specific endonuclease VapC
MRYRQIGKKASPKHEILVNNFVLRLDAILPWDSSAVDATVEIKRRLTESGNKIGVNDMAIAGHAISSGSILITNNVSEFSRVARLRYDDWTNLT